MRCAVCGEVEGHVVHREHAFDAAIPASKVRELAEKWKNTPGWRGLGEALEAHLLRDSEGGAK